jgi:hypothetical protein
MKFVVENIDPEVQFAGISRNPLQTATKEAACEMALGAKL